MAAAFSEIAPDVLEFRSAALSLIAVVLKATAMEPLAAELERRACTMPGLFDDEPVAIDLSCVRDEAAPPDFKAMIALFRRHRMLPVAARGGNAEQMAAALAAGLAEAPEGARAPREAAAAVVERIVEVQVAALPPMIVDKPLRSGQQIYARDRDLIVLALVSYGAEVIADGHIHVYAPLRGRALAGAQGNAQARIFATAMQAQLLAIAGVYRTGEAPWPDAVAGHAAMVRLVDGSLTVEALERSKP
jgi:septum site-determining protein MinC